MTWAIAFFVLTLLLALLSWKARRSWTRLVAINLAAVCCGLALFETYLAIEAAKGDGTRLEGSVTEDFTRPDDTLGYVPNENRRVTARKLYGDNILYDVVYTIGPDGLRISPPRTAAHTQACVLFFGDSITFGEGVGDDENYPYLVGLKTGYEVHNFAFSGYGPHHMLAALQSGRVDHKIACTPTHVIYLCFSGHIERVAGLTSWDKHGPRFRLRADGSVYREGNFDSPAGLFGSSAVSSWVNAALDRFLTWQKFFGRARKGGQAELSLLRAIIRAAAADVQRRYDGSKFHVVLWDGGDDERTRAIEAGLMAANLPVYRLTAAIPDLPSHWEDYVISPYDMHPNRRQHEALAQYVVSKIVAPGTIRP